jgi:hypothetical protein
MAGKIAQVGSGENRLRSMRDDYATARRGVPLVGRSPTIGL